MITGLEVSLVEIFISLALVQKVINPRDWVPISDSALVQCPIVDTEFAGPILLLYQYN